MSERYPRPLLPALYPWLVAAFSALATSQGVAGDPEMSAYAEAALAVDDDAGTSPSHESFYDRLWSVPDIYENENNPFIQRFRFKGRYAGQYAVVESNRGAFDDWFDRQARIGFEVEMFHRVTIGGEINLNTAEDFGPLYDDISTANIEIALTDTTTLTIGKLKPSWSWEYDTSLKRFVTFERTLLNSQLRPTKSTGIGLSGEMGDWIYQTGIFSGDLNEEFGNLDGGWFAYGSLIRDLSESVDFDMLSIRGDYLYNDPEPGDTGAEPYRHLFAASVILGDGSWEWTTEALYGTGISPDAYGISSLLTYWLEDQKWQGVLRYQYAHGDDDSLRVQKRYERAVPNLTDGGHGGEYHAAYAGLNRYLYLDKLKLMTGVEWSNMDGGDDGGSFDGWTMLAGIRFYF